MNVVPKHINECMNRSCPAFASLHHHLHIGPEDAETHSDAMVACSDERCKKVVHGLVHDEAVDEEPIRPYDEAIAKEAMRIAEWWVEQAKQDAARTVPKAVEYGSADFDLMGQFMVALVGDKLDGADDGEKMRVGREMAVAFYLIGKLGRAVGSYSRGVMPSDDTIYDTRIYAMMWERIRQTGYWIEG